MVRKWWYGLSCLLIVALMAPFATACTPVQAAEGYVVLVPERLPSGGATSVTFSLYGHDGPVRDRVEVLLLQGDDEVASDRAVVDGRGTLVLDVPELEEGEYTVVVRGTGFEQRTPVRVEKTRVVFVETDKPIYKPGQIILMRVLTLDPELKPVREDVVIEVLDAKGVKLMRATERSDEYGLVNFELPLANELNLGTWQIVAEVGDAKTQLDVVVERYVLPKYDVNVDLTREWFLVNDAITGVISSEYSFGRPVNGEVEITASRYVGQWEEFATFRSDIDGEADFRIPAVGYVAGVPEAGGQGNVMLDITVTEDVTGYVERTSRLLTVADSPVNLQLIPEGAAFKPGLPFSVLVITETPDNRPVEADVRLEITFLNSEFQDIKTVTKDVTTASGKALVKLDPPAAAIAMSISARSEGGDAERMVEASFSPSSSFIHVEQVSDGVPQVGENIEFRIHATSDAQTFYYEVVSRDRIVFSGYTKERQFSFQTTPLMAPASRLLVYQVLQNSEVAADYLPFKVTGSYPHDVEVSFNTDEAEPGEDVEIRVQTQGRAMVGLAAVDKSVFILAENRLNLQQVFAELERLYMEPQAELHDVSIYHSIETKGAAEVFSDAGVVVLSNAVVPEGQRFDWQGQQGFWEGLLGFLVKGGMMPEFARDAAGALPPQAAPSAPAAPGAEGLVEVERVRQYFPETWIWEQLETGSDGRGSLGVTVPDSITTWMLRAVGISRDHGLGIAEAQLRAFQPFFLTLDLPYAAIRGEEFPVSVSIYNYLDAEQEIRVELEDADWFELRDDAVKTVRIGPNDLGAARFTIRPTRLGVNAVEVKAQGQAAADAMSKTIIIEPEGVSREVVDNLVLSAGDTRHIDSTLPASLVTDSGRVYLALTSSLLTQTMEGLDQLIQMPFGCGEQNMMLFAPNTYITRYLEESGQLKPEIMAKIDMMMVTGYQRQLTYRHSDGSFSAFGQSDQEGSLWLTAFVLKAFSEAKDIVYIDERVISEALKWVVSHQNNDGSFDQVGFVHHQEMLGGMQGRDALTAFVAVALLEAGDTTAAGKAIDYLEDQLGDIEDAYTLALTAYALELGGSGKRDDAVRRLMDLAQEDENGLYWGDAVRPVAEQQRMMPYPVQQNSAAIETTGYATMALTLHGDVLDAARAAQWISAQRNSLGGFGSTQDTVVGIQALVAYQTGARADVDLTVSVIGDGFKKDIRIDSRNYDVLQIIQLPQGREFELRVEGKGRAVGQVVRRFNMPVVEARVTDVLEIEVNYDTTDVEVDDLVTVSARLRFNPPEFVETGMVVLDISIPTGFAAVAETLDAAVAADARLKRYETAGRKVIFYIENLRRGESVELQFQVKALYPVKAKAVSSRAYSYYSPELSGQTLGPDVTVR